MPVDKKILSTLFLSFESNVKLSKSGDDILKLLIFNFFRVYKLSTSKGVHKNLIFFFSRV